MNKAEWLMITGHLESLTVKEASARNLPKNKRATLEELIKEHVAPVMFIMTDFWRGYAGLNQQMFEHVTVNYKYHFVDPDTVANTQMSTTESP